MVMIYLCNINCRQWHSAHGVKTVDYRNMKKTIIFNQISGLEVYNGISYKEKFKNIKNLRVNGYADGSLYLNIDYCDGTHDSRVINIKDVEQ